MISRVAESCFWLARYLERVDTTSRLLDVNSSFSLDIPNESPDRWRPLVIVVGQEKDFLDRYGADAIEDAETVQRYLVWDEENPCSIYSSTRAVRENARTTREVITVEMWELVNEFWLWINSRRAKNLYERDRDDFYAHLNQQCLMFHGTCFSTMLHDDPFTFIQLGRAVERAGQTARVMDVHHHALRETDDDSPADAAQWIAILKSCSGYEPFFKRTAAQLSGPKVAEFLLLDRTFPRSVLHNFDRIRLFLERLLVSRREDLGSVAWEFHERLRGSLLQMDGEDVAARGLHETLTWLVDDTTQLCDAIRQDFFSVERAVKRRSVITKPPPSQSQSQTSG